MIETLAKSLEVATEAAESASESKIDPDARVEMENSGGETRQNDEVDPDARIVPLDSIETGKSGEISPFYNPSMPINDFPVVIDKEEMPNGDSHGNWAGMDVLHDDMRGDAFEFDGTETSTTKDVPLLKQESMQKQENPDDPMWKEARAP